MSTILILTEENEQITELLSRLTQSGFACSVASQKDDAIGQVSQQAPDLVLLAADDLVRAQELSRKIKEERPLPVIALVRREMLDMVNGHLDMDDFVVTPGDLTELAVRIKRLLQRSNHQASSELIECGGLLLDLAKCEVTVNGKPVELTFREYELLRFLASNRSRVFTRDVLLDKVWGYDYYGGDRTVDVHIRRLRSKIEDSSHTFIETVRNMGYRFKGKT